VSILRAQDDDMTTIWILRFGTLCCAKTSMTMTRGWTHERSHDQPVPVSKPGHGTLVHTDAICPREAWLMAHELEPEDFGPVGRGRLNQEVQTGRRRSHLPG